MPHSPIRRRARARALYAACKPSGRSVEATRRQLSYAAWAARTEGDWATYREIMRSLAELRDRSKADGWKPTTDEARRVRRETPRTPPVVLEREAAQRVEHDERRQRPLDPEKAARNLIRWRAEAVCEALWGVAWGTREWEHIPTRPITANVYVSDGQTTASVQTPQRLTVRVPGLHQLGIEAHHLRIYRAEYDALLEGWGVPQQRSLQAARLKLNDSKAAETLYAAALRSLPQPELALAWADYLSGSRLGAVFQLDPRRGEVRLAARRSTALRECALQLGGLAEVCPPVT
ncbi:hypothetical protein [Deinococcus radiophilus]|uniref:Uncharacterized protein n=1 Tax=Deinococcus radiophilus TaxID=32062 RepID=A0A431W0L5_9DEIO|nr:hypothetical protein [Deinococcus radiophilus]RTR29051.1 hypothetical protein EJ104_04190 [Deinococcus radiophilus]UFA49638.1 hypothetical protein LMT64_06950 [Deinococcus radiophilus]